MISPVSGASQVSEVTATGQAASASQTQQATLKPDSTSISQKGQQMSAHRAGGDGDGDGH